MSIEKTKEILVNTNELISIYNNEKQKNCEDFNLLEVSGISRLEVNMCRILAELIKPDGVHYQNDLFLKSFVRDVLKIDISDEELEKTNVFTEYPTDTNRRIDIAILTPLRFIPIEAKIHAKDQESQCGDYYTFAKTKSKITSKVYYLTLDGHLPYEDAGLTPIVQDGEIIGYEELVTLSFCDDIYNWINSIIESVKNKTMLYTSLVQIKNALGKAGGKMDKKLHDEVSSLISENSDNMKTALAIAESITVAKENLMIKLFERFENEMRMLNFPLEQLHNKYDYKYDNYSSVHNYYRKKSSKIFPAVVYSYKKLDKSIEIWFVIEVGTYGSIYCGFVTAKNGENIGEILIPEKEIGNYLNPEFGINKDEWWFYWEYLPEHTGEYYLIDKFPDFKDVNNFYVDLYDNDNFEEYIKLCMTRIKTMLDAMIRTEVLV